MTPIVLLADDSVTIQKVIKITLANELYDLVETPSEENLITKVKDLKPNLVLLDFSLSPTKSGYDLVKLIKQFSPQCAVLLMFGTFDPIDENAINECGADEKIVKPFDSTKFVNICRSILSDSLDSDFSLEENSSEENVEILDPAQETNLEGLNDSDSDDSQNWVVKSNSAAETKKFPENVHALPKRESNPNKNALEAELEDWGVNIPPIIGASNKKVAERSDIPKVIEQKKLEELKQHFHKTPVGVGQAELDSLDQEDILEQEETLGQSKAQEIKLSSKLIPLSELKPSSDKNNANDDKTSEFVIDEDLQQEISLDQSSTGLWSPDSDQEAKNIQSQSDLFIDTSHSNNKFDNIDVRLDSSYGSAPKETKNENPIHKSSTQSSVEEVNTKINVSELEEKLRREMRPIIEKLVKEICHEAVERVAWEVIPDLAENLIRNEITKIADSVISE